ncbi:MAG: PLDc N-terminal domain-containing protein [Haloferacaceae archaeon]
MVPVPLQAGGVARLIGLFMILGLIVAVGWTYADAQDNSDHPAFLWALVVFLAPLLGIVLYLLLGRR